jgi:ectoine hydroxylase-related dioxygenase (phytanoyl-CoA dioxygenase family)
MPDLTLPAETNALKTAYATDGVVPVPGLLSGAMLDDLVEAVKTFRASEDLNKDSDPRTSVKHLPGRSIVRGLAHTAGTVRSLVTNPHVAAFLATVTGADGLRYWNDLTLAYAPAAPAGESPWHHDMPAFPLRASQMPTLWIALSDVNWDSSPLVFVPGSHKSDHLFPPSTVTEASLPDGYASLPDWPKPDFDEQAEAGPFKKLWWPMKPGDAVIMDGKVVHCTPANRNETDERVSILIRWVSDNAVWHRDQFSTPVPGIAEEEWRPGEPAPASFV